MPECNGLCTRYAISPSCPKHGRQAQEKELEISRPTAGFAPEERQEKDEEQAPRPA